jgi:F0F1-type ATP synthase epsilon subunit
MSKEQPTLHVHVSRATATVWEGDAVSISSKNATGEFDILPMHANFISVVENNPFVIRMSNGTEEKFTFKKAVIFVRGNTVRIFANLE